MNNKIYDIFLGCGVLNNYPFPINDFDSLTQYEMLTKCISAIKKLYENDKTLTNRINALYDYVTNYFNNLDVQEEINHKIDEMVEDGTLEEIITSYLQIKGVLSFNNINEMKSATNLIDGSIAKTLGYNSINDGGNALYKIREVTNQDVVDNGSIIPLNNESLIAELIYEDINPMTFGCYGDGIHDDTNALKSAVDFAKEKNLKLYSLKDKIYKVSETIDFSTLFVDFNDAEITTDENIEIIKLDSNSDDKYTVLQNITINCNNVANIGLYIYSIRRSKINNINIINVKNIGIDTSNYGFENMLTNINIQNDDLNTNTIGININTTDNHYTNICMSNISTAFVLSKGSNYFNNVHCWIGSENLINGSKMFDIRVSSNTENNFNSVYSDTYQYTFYYTTSNVLFTYINNLTVRYNNEFYLTTHNDSYVFYNQYDTQTKYIFINNCLIIGLRLNDTDKTYFTNRTYFQGKVLNYEISNSHYNNVYSLLNVNANLTVDTNEIKIEGNTVTIDFIASYDSSVTTNPYINFSPAANIPDFLAPKKAITSNCIVTDSRWQFYDAEVGYLYLSAQSETNKTMQLRASSGSGTKYIFVHIVYTI